MDCSMPVFRVHHQSPITCSNSCLLSRWCHPIISSSVIPFSSCLQSFPASGSFPMSQFFTSVSQKLELQLQHQSFQWIFRTDFLWDWLVWSPCSPRDLWESSATPQFKSISCLALNFLYGPIVTSVCDIGKIIALTRQSFVGKVMSLFFNKLSRLLVLAFFQGVSIFYAFMVAVTNCIYLGAQENKVCHCFNCLLIYLL